MRWFVVAAESIDGADQRRPLAGLTVIEMGNFIAAPSAGRLLAEFGAEVIKIERPRTGDELRGWRQYAGETSLLFRLLGRNKKSVTLDLRTGAGRDIALYLLEGADVLLENFRPGTLERWGLGPETLHQLNPELIVSRISGYGQTGPYRDRPGFGGVAEALGGLRNLTGYPDRPPVRVGISLADSVAGLYAVIGVLLSLVGRRPGTGRQERSSAGEIVDVALYEAVYSLTESLVAEYEAFGVNRGPSGSTIPGVVPSNSYRCSDGKYVVIGGNNDAIFGRLMTLIERADLANDARLRHNQGRVENAALVEKAIESWAAERDSATVLAGLREYAIPSGPIYTAADIAADPHFAARGMLQRHAVPLGDDRTADVTFPGIVPKMARRPGHVRWVGPELGAHTDEVLAAAGVDGARREQLRSAGVIGP